MILRDWKKCKGVFKHPKVMVYFGFWSTPWFISKIATYLLKAWKNKELKNTREYKIYQWIFDHVKHTECAGLPVWRHGNGISLFRKHWMWDYKDREHIIKWQPDFKEKLKKLHLEWLKPQYELPTWLACYVFRIPLMWKWKYDDVRHEFNPQLTFVLFNICLSFYWVSPYRPKSEYDLYYWESILNYNEKLPKEMLDKPLFEQMKWLADEMGCWVYTEKDKDGNEIKNRVWQLQPEFLKDKNLAKEIRKYEVDQKSNFDSQNLYK